MSATVHEWCGQVDDPERDLPCPCPHTPEEARGRAQDANARHAKAVRRAGAS